MIESHKLKTLQPKSTPHTNKRTNGAESRMSCSHETHQRQDEEVETNAHRKISFEMITESTLNNSHWATNKLENSILSHETIMPTLNTVFERREAEHRRKKNLYKIRILCCVCVGLIFLLSFSLCCACCYQNLLFSRIFSLSSSIFGL